MPTLEQNDKIAIIIGAGPAGLTAAFELLKRTDYKPIVIEQLNQVGGLSKTVNYKGNLMDLGGHRFFTKSDRVWAWWQQFFAVKDSDAVKLQYKGLEQTIKPMQQITAKHYFLVRERKSQIMFQGQLLPYPLKIGWSFIQATGLLFIAKAMFGYVSAKLSPIKPEKSLEDFYINRFGSFLYEQFFKSYTEKVWGRACSEISRDWGAQRVKSLDIAAFVKDGLAKFLNLNTTSKPITLTEYFLYPEKGPGQLWEAVADSITELGGKIIFNAQMDAISLENNAVNSVSIIEKNGSKQTVNCHLLFSSAPIPQLAILLDQQQKSRAFAAINNLKYRNLIVVGMLFNQTDLTERKGKEAVKNTWIYVQERNSIIGRLQIFNNWSPFMVVEPNHVWIAAELFCSTDDALYNLTEGEIKKQVFADLFTLGLFQTAEPIESNVLKIPYSYPAYWDGYEQIGEIETWLSEFKNIYPIGRNGLHRYNNQDHAMLSAMVAVDNIENSITDKSNIWAINTEEEYLEEIKKVPVS